MNKEAYYCGICKKRYYPQTGQFRVNCAVMHPQGSCCHYGEEKVKEEPRMAGYESNVEADNG